MPFIAPYTSSKLPERERERLVAAPAQGTRVRWRARKECWPLWSAALALEEGPAASGVIGGNTVGKGGALAQARLTTRAMTEGQKLASRSALKYGYELAMAKEGET